MGKGAHKGNTSDVAIKAGHGHASEAVFAAILADAGIGHEYEPDRLHVGVLEIHGKVRDRALQPDFRVEELDMYVELTTSKVGSMNMTSKLAKVSALNRDKGQHRICIMDGAALNWFCKNAGDMNRDQIIEALNRAYRVTCKRAGIRVRKAKGQAMELAAA